MSAPTELRHLAISPDGNRRWAARRGQSPAEGYTAALDVLPGLIEVTRSRGISHLSLHAMNHLSWTRPAGELEAVMDTVTRFVGTLAEPVATGAAAVTWVGYRHHVPTSLRHRIEELEDASPAHDSTAELQIALYLDYDAGDHLRAASGDVDALEPVGFPPVDLYIRTSGNQRTSGFDPLRIAQAELMFAEGGFPDFTAERLSDCLDQFAGRTRTFGR